MRSLTVQFFIIFIIIIYLDLFYAKKDDVSEIHWIHYDGRTINSFKKYTLVNIKKLTSSKNFRSRNKTVIYIHGYEESMRANSSKTIVAAYLAARPYTNIIVLDWSNLSDKGYLNNAASHTDMVGRAAGTYLLDIIGSVIQKKNLHIIGYCLGCHVAAALARKTQIHGVTLNRITGLDCAFLGYTPQVIGTRLNTRSALFVDVIHTDSARYGIPIKIGHVDFWPNGGNRTQPGCATVSIFQTINSRTLINELCSHYISWIFYAESVRNPKNFAAVRCDSYGNFKSGYCSEKHLGYMGYGATSSLSGNYYLSTSSTSPYGQGIKGVRSIK